MPELPEVETIKAELSLHVIGRNIKGVTLLWEGIVRQPSAEEFRSRITGQKIVGLARRGKYLIFSLNGVESLLVHLKMSGALLLKVPAELNRFIRAIIHLDNGTRIYFRDPRKFGRMWLVKDTDAILGGLGPEPLEDGFTTEVLAQRLDHRKAPIKAILCDQSVIAGIGNMYADEALFRAKVHPLRLAGSLSRDEVGRLHHAIKQVLWAAIGNMGASILNYYRPGGEVGTAHSEFQVAHRRGETCPVCGTPIERIKVRNRGSYFCPKCQPP